MNTWRILKLEINDAAMNMSIDEAILRTRLEGSVPNTLRFYKWKPSAVSIGRFQKLENEVILENCRKLGIDVVRRISGGGTVFHDESEVTYAVIAKTEDLGTKDVSKVYDRIYAAISEALRTIGISSDFSPGDAKNCPNLTVNGKKISGSAQAHKSGVVLQHGTLLMEVNLLKMFTVLRVPWANNCMQVVNVAKGKITSVQNELGHTLKPETAINAIAHGFAVALNLQVVENVQSLEDKLTPEEQALAKKLYREKYSTRDWNFEGKSTIG
ncbi:MAG TPA: biotin/lipoate A/B protein ligase family protein [Candidatus Acidoferrales bacterium]|nr:biotin/lipoate A/B protein ligase family protein [Candidatus Acidoferrales bacterium]